MATKVHFMGIGGSGMSAVAQIAQAYGYEVSGCDQAESTPYLEKVLAAGIPFTHGHSADHVKNADLLAVSPAVFFQNDTHPETVAARRSGKLMKWQTFLGSYLHQKKRVICVAGTNGKSTTTALAGLVLEAAKLDPTVEVGATVKEWHNNLRIGQSDFFISEADEYHDNFLEYHPDMVILTNIELDHPEYFHTFDNMLKSYAEFLSQIQPNGTLIYNADDPGIQKLLRISNFKFQIKQIPYSHSEYSAARFPLSILGRHNQTNAMSVIKLAELLGIPEEKTATALKAFTGLARRLELVGSPNGIKIYDDYANLPTAFKANIEALKQLHPQERLLVIIEPHTFSRLRAVLSDLPDALKAADEVIITKIYASRETDPGDFTGANIATATHHPHAHYIPEFADIVSYLISHKSSFTVVLVMGSGNSYQLSRQLVAAL